LRFAGNAIGLALIEGRGTPHAADAAGATAGASSASSSSASSSSAAAAAVAIEGVFGRRMTETPASARCP